MKTATITDGYHNRIEMGANNQLFIGAHTVSLNAPEDAKQIKVGGSHLNEKAATPAPTGAVGQGPPADASTDPNAPPPAPRITSSRSNTALAVSRNARTLGAIRGLGVTS